MELLSFTTAQNLKAEYAIRIYILKEGKSDENVKYDYYNILA